MSKIMDAMPMPPDSFQTLVEELDAMDMDNHGPLTDHRILGRERAMKRVWASFKLAVKEAMEEAMEETL